MEVPTPEPQAFRFRYRRGTLSIAVAFCFLACFAMPLDADPGAPELLARGIVSGPLGPAADVEVTLEYRDMRERRPRGALSTTTDARGAFSFDLGAFDWPEYGLAFTTDARRYVPAYKLVIVPRDQMPVSVEIRLQAGAIARGTVIDTGGKPIAGVEVTGRDMPRQVSGDDGTWEMYGLPLGTSIQLVFRKPGYGDAFLAVPTESPEILSGFEVVMESARTFSGVVTDTNGSPVPRADVVLSVGDRFVRQTTGPDGRFAIKGAPPDLEGADVSVTRSPFLPLERPLRPAETTGGDVELVMSRGIYLEGRSLLPGPVPAAGASISLHDPVTGDSTRRFPVGASGEWRVGPLPPGVERNVVVLPPTGEGFWAVADLFVQPGARPRTATGVVELWPRGHSSSFEIEVGEGRLVMLRDDAGVGGFAGPIHYEAPWSGPTDLVEGSVSVSSTGQSGTFRMTRQSAPADSIVGVWELYEEFEATERHLAPAMQSVRTNAIPAAMTMQLDLDQGHRLEGQVLQSDGTPFTDGTVVLLGWQGIRTYTATAVIGAGGRFAFESVPHGVFYLTAVNKEGTRNAPPIPAHGGIEGVVLVEGPLEPDPLDD